MVTGLWCKAISGSDLTLRKSDQGDEMQACDTGTTASKKAISLLGPGQNLLKGGCVRLVQDSYDGFARLHARSLVTFRPA